MLDNLLELVRSQAGDAIINNPAIPNERNEEAIAAASNSITGGLQSLLSGGNLKDVLGLFTNQGSQAVASNPSVQHISGGFVQDMMARFGLDQGTAGGMAQNLIPGILQKLAQKTTDPGDSSFNIQGIFNQLSGGGTSSMNIQGLLNKVTAGQLDADGDGDTDLQDVMALFKGKGGQGGNILDSVKGLFN